MARYPPALSNQCSQPNAKIKLVDIANELKNLSAGRDAVIRYVPANGEGSGLVKGYDGH